MTTSLFTRPPADRPASFTSIQEAQRSITILDPTKKGWFNDPLGQHRFRFHDGLEWTEHTTHCGPVPCLGCR